MDSITASEGALKLKEISYIMCESYPAGELKHGTLALVDESSLSIILSTNTKMIDKLNNTIEEIKARGGKVLIISPFNNYLTNKNIDHYITLPKIQNEKYYCLSSIIPLQLLAYYSSILKGNNPDKPRNLAKSVTVE